MKKIVSLGQEQFVGKLRKSGNSMVVSVPSEVRERLNLGKDEGVFVTLNKIPEQYIDDLRTRLELKNRYRFKGSGRLIWSEKKLASIDELYYSIESTVMEPVKVSFGGQTIKEGEEERVKLIRGVIFSSQIKVDEEKFKELAHRGTLEVETEEKVFKVNITTIDDRKGEEVGEGENYLDRKYFYGKVIEEEKIDS